MNSYDNTKLSLMQLVTFYILIGALIKIYSSTPIAAVGARCPS